jgi:hypothetical protein
MDFQKLQQKLFQIEPTDRAADRAAMVASMQGANPQESVQVEENFLQESVNVPQGTMPVEGNYSISDFAKLAGVTLNEGKQKHGSAGQLKGKDAFTKSSKPGGNESPHPARNKLVGDSMDNDIEEGPIDAVKAVNKSKGLGGAFQTGYNATQKGGALAPDALNKALSGVFTGNDKKDKTDTKGKNSVADKYATSIQNILKDPALKRELLILMKKANSKSQMNSEAQKKPKKPLIKARNPGYKDLQALRTSGAGGSHTDKTKVLPRKQKYKTDPTQESIKEMLFRKLNEKSS